MSCNVYKRLPDICPLTTYNMTSRHPRVRLVEHKAEVLKAAYEESGMIVRRVLQLWQVHSQSREREGGGAGGENVGRSEGGM